MGEEEQVSIARGGVAVEFAFPLGRYHATAAGTAVNEGESEWPPSPWRILRAFVSVWRLRLPNLDEATVTGVLDALAAPCVFTLPRAAGAHTRHYLVGEKNDERDTFLTLDPFMSCERSARMVATWPDVTLNFEQRDVLGQIAAHLTYLGRAESLCDARLLDPDVEASPPNAAPDLPDVPGPDGEAIRLLVPDRPLNLEDLCVRLDLLRSDSKRRSVLPPSVSYVTYRRATEPPVVVARRRQRREIERVTAVRFRLAAVGPGRRPVRPPLIHALLYTSVLRAACQSVYGKRVGEGRSPTLSGRVDSVRRSGHGHAHYIALPAHLGESAAGGADWVRGRRIEALLVWAPAGLDHDELAALLDVRKLFGAEWIADFRPAGLVVEGFGPSASVLPELAGPSSTFESITPVMPGTHPRVDVGWTSHVESEVRFSLAERGLPEPVAVEARPVARGFLTQRPSIGSLNRRPHRALNHPHRVRIEFPEAVPGPVCVGALSHFGLGLFAPVPAA